jgi:DNA-binding PadR family transcriptional regulator
MRLVPREWSDLNATERDVLLGFAVDSPTTAYSVWQRVNPDVDPAGVYSPLQRLQEQGYIEQVSEGETRQEGNKNQITDDGMRLVRQAVVDPAAEIE